MADIDKTNRVPSRTQIRNTQQQVKYDVAGLVREDAIKQVIILSHLHYLNLSSNHSKLHTLVIHFLIFKLFCRSLPNTENVLKRTDSY